MAAVSSSDGKLTVAPGESEILAAEKAGVVSAQDAQALLRLEELTREIVAVDDFESEELGTKPFRDTRKRQGTKK